MSGKIENTWSKGLRCLDVELMSECPQNMNVMSECQQNVNVVSEGAQSMNVVSEGAQSVNVVSDSVKVMLEHVSEDVEIVVSDRKVSDCSTELSGCSTDVSGNPTPSQQRAEKQVEAWRKFSLRQPELGKVASKLTKTKRVPPRSRGEPSVYDMKCGYRLRTWLAQPNVTPLGLNSAPISKLRLGGSYLSSNLSLV